MDALFLIGEKLNSTAPSVRAILETRDETALLSLARAQIEGGASCVDLNASMLMGGEEEALRWGARIVRKSLNVPVMLDSPDAHLLERLALEFGAGSILNSITADEDTLEETLPAVSRAGSRVVVMLKDRRGVPAVVEEKLDLAERTVECASRMGMNLETVFFDSVFMPVATAQGRLIAALDCVRLLRERFPACGRIGGLSNVSFGLPERKLLNRSFAAAAVAFGITALICDTTDRELMKTLHASETLAGLDPHCRRYLEYYRKAQRPA